MGDPANYSTASTGHGLAEDTGGTSCAVHEWGFLEYHPDPAWRRDVALEMWIDAERAPVSIRLTGTLDHATAANLVSVMEGLIAEGGRDFDLETAALHVSDAGGAGVLVELQRLVQRSGGRITRDGSAIAGPVLVRGNGVGLSCVASRRAQVDVERAG